MKWTFLGDIRRIDEFKLYLVVGQFFFLQAKITIVVPVGAFATSFSSKIESDNYTLWNRSNSCTHFMTLYDFLFFRQMPFPFFAQNTSFSERIVFEICGTGNGGFYWLMYVFFCLIIMLTSHLIWGSHSIQRLRKLKTFY